MILLWIIGTVLREMLADGRGEESAGEYGEARDGKVHLPTSR